MFSFHGSKRGEGWWGGEGGGRVGTREVGVRWGVGEGDEGGQTCNLSQTLHGKNFRKIVYQKNA